jgi:hypothetical protein
VRGFSGLTSGSVFNLKRESPVISMLVALQVPVPRALNVWRSAPMAPALSSLSA